MAGKWIFNMKILIINGPNLNLLSHRDSNHYGQMSLEEIEEWLGELEPSIELSWVQSNIEGEIVEYIQQVVTSDKFDGLVINPGGFSHTSIAILDALQICTKPKLEVHLSQVYQRGAERQFLTARACDGVISGLKQWGYYMAIKYLKESLRDEVSND